MKPTIKEVIDILKLEPLGREGGMFRSTYHSSALCGDRCAGSAIFFFLTANAFSHLHRLPTDELYHFYFGDPVEFLELFPDGSSRCALIGSDILNNQNPQLLAHAGSWQGSHLLDGGEYALMGTTMSPGFIESDYEHANADLLISQYPLQAELIRKLTGTLRYT
ncbi:MAG: cupin domain-containing protein [Christensenella sp.]